ncbi:MAG: hypothetical protein O7B99_02115 [Planctomycetota bacterium]|nr:hypothetical protein [Planctomycetota bacterium]
MGGFFETSDGHKGRNVKPIRVPTLKGDVYDAAKEMIDDLDGWELVEEDAEKGVLTCRKKGGVLAGMSTITVTVEGPDGIPSTTVNVRSETEGGMRSPDKANVVAFVKPFFRRIC